MVVVASECQVQILKANQQCTHGNEEALRGRSVSRRFAGEKHVIDVLQIQLQNEVSHDGVKSRTKS